MHTFIFLSAVFVLTIFVIWFFIIKPNEKKIEEQRKQFQFIQDESIRILNESGKISASEFIEEHTDELIEMPPSFFYGRKFRTIKEFFDNLINEYTEEELDNYVKNNQYRDIDIMTFSVLIREALLSETPA